MGNYCYDKYIFDHFTFFPALCGGDDEGDRAATPYSNRTTSCYARILGQLIHKIVGYSSYGDLFHSCSFCIHASYRRAV